MTVCTKSSHRIVPDSPARAAMAEGGGRITGEMPKPRTSASQTKTSVRPNRIGTISAVTFDAERAASQTLSAQPAIHAVRPSKIHISSAPSVSA